MAKADEDWVKLLNKARAGNAEAQYNAGMEYDTGRTVNGKEIVKQDGGKAYKWIKAAADQGYEPALLRLADYMSEGANCEPDIERAMDIYKHLIAKGESAAAHNLGIVYRNLKQPKKAFALYKKALEISNEKGTLALALCYYHGIGTAKDIGKAKQILQMISDGTITASGYDENEANYLLGVMYMSGEGVKRSVAKARKYLLLAAEDNDHSSAQQLLQVIGWE